jgi:hypothetical protein
VVESQAIDIVAAPMEVLWNGAEILPGGRGEVLLLSIAIHPVSPRYVQVFL